MMEDFHAGRCQMENLNKVYLILLPKTVGAKSIGDFWPISLSNSIYLIMAKVLANRLREVLDGLISPFQSAFILGRQMIDSVVLAEEIVAAWRRSSTTGFMRKVHFAKANDSIDWLVSMECAEKTWLPGGMGEVGKIMSYYDVFLLAGKRTAPRGMVSTTKGHQTRLSVCTATIHFGS